MANQLIDMVGMRFGLLLVSARVASTARGQSRWECKCDCGSTKIVVGSSLKRGATKSCGCARAESIGKAKTTHGQHGTRAHKIWTSMIQRCRDKNQQSYAYYGARGITVCDAWQTFDGFARDMLPIPFDGASLDRIDNDKGYSLDNCRWVTRADQHRNKRSNRLVTIGEETKILADWCRHYGVDPNVVQARLRCGWEMEPALIQPVRPKRAHAHKHQ